MYTNQTFYIMLDDTDWNMIHNGFHQLVNKYHKNTYKWKKETLLISSHNTVDHLCGTFLDKDYNIYSYYVQ